MFNNFLLSSYNYNYLKYKQNKILVVNTSNITQVTSLLKKLNFFLFVYTAINYPNKQKDLLVIANFGSYVNKQRINVMLSSSGIIDSITPYFASALWTERETFDMFG